MGLQQEQTLPAQMDIENWPTLRKRFEETFASKTQDEWTKIFEGTDACVTPVLELGQLMQHPHNQHRKLLQQPTTKVTQPGNTNTDEVDVVDTIPMPSPAPRLSRTPAEEIQGKRQPVIGQHTQQVLKEFGFAEDEIQSLLKRRVVGGANRSQLAAL